MSALLDGALVAVGAGVGAPLRFLAAGRLDASGGLPAGTLLVNLVGSFLLGLFAGLALDGAALALLGTGLCGGLTTYSGLAVQTHGLLRTRPLLGLAYAGGTLALGLALCALGFVLAA